MVGGAEKEEEAGVQRVTSSTAATARRASSAKERTTEVAFGRAVEDKTPGAMPEAVRRRLERLEHEALVKVAERLIEEILTAGQVMVAAPTTTTSRTASGGGGRARGAGGGRGGGRARPTSGRGEQRGQPAAAAAAAKAAGGDSSSSPAARAKQTTRARRLLSDSVELHSLVHLNQLQVCGLGALTHPLLTLVTLGRSRANAPN